MIPSFVKMPLIRAFDLGKTLLFDMQWTMASLSNPSSKDHGDWDFTTGSGPDDDLPAHFSIFVLNHDPAFILSAPET